ncbi:MBL fold metallo-hydrolase [Rhodococcus opacus]|uniref:MBL fold metallo-hydrolase n=1 Tax=Rhodococcus opacus TaxID=37919 RepID=UPI002285F87F|nr:MBL fold metallo-hydrolase [Rhodococcus opacus]
MGRPGNRAGHSAALRQLGHRLDDITVCLATHHHGDHYSQAFAWRTTVGCALFAGREERHSIDSFLTDVGRFPNHPPLLTRCGATRLAERIARNGEAREGADIAHGRPDGWPDHGDVIPLRDGALEVIATPGHTRGHVVFQHTDTRILFSGDHILPRITPSIGFEWAPEPYPLRSYLRSLELVRGLPAPHCCLLTAPVTASTRDRVDEILHHHRERLDEVCEHIAAGATAAYHVAKSMRRTHRRRQLDELPPEHRLSAVMEITAHLDVLPLHGRLKPH